MPNNAQNSMPNNSQSDNDDASEVMDFMTMKYVQIISSRQLAGERSICEKRAKQMRNSRVLIGWTKWSFDLDIDIRRVKSYLGRAAELLACAQSKIVVFGSGRARNVPDGFDREKAEAQFIDSLLWSADALKGSDTTLVIEPLNRKESNIVNSVGEGVRFAKAVNRPEIRVLADIYHMDEENEPLSEVAIHVEWLSHIHLADTGRFNPGTGSYDYDSFFGYLKAANYRGMLSVECTVKNPEADMRLSLGFLRQHWPSAR